MEVAPIHNFHSNRNFNMKYRLSSLLLFGLMLAAAPTFAQGIVHDEALMGDLSDSGATPTGVTFGLGLNTIQGSLGGLGAGGGGGATNGNDADIFTFTLGAGQTVTSISTTRSDSAQGFLGYANTSSIPAVTDNGSLATAVTSGTLFGTETVSGAGGLAGNGLAAIPSTLGAGDHTFFLQETVTPVDFSISFTVAQVVPEPSSAALLGGLAMVGFIRRRRR